jgi:hypothetical protein
MRQSTSDLQQIAHALSSAPSAKAASASNGSTATGAEDVIDAEFEPTK